MKSLQLIDIEGGAVGVVLPKSLLLRLDWKAGDELLAEQAESGLLLSKPSVELAHQLALGREIMRQHSDVLRALARSEADASGE